MTVDRASEIVFRCFAKVNLSLEVLGRRADGFHELRTVFQTVDLHDLLGVELGGEGVRLEVRRAQAELHAAELGIEAAQVAVDGAEAAYESRLAQLRAGNTTPAEVYDSERQLNRARLQLLDARVQRQLARVHQRYAMGEL